ncbi:MAG: hypothetical protein ACTHJY_13425 [Rhizobiaceae bacterium]
MARIERGPEPMIGPATGEEGKRALAIYILLIVSMMAVGVLTMPIALIMACSGLFKRNTPQWVRSHYWFQLRNVLVFVISIAAIFMMLPGVAAEVRWAGYVFLAGVIGLALFIVRCFWGLVILNRRNSIPVWLV